MNVVDWINWIEFAERMIIKEEEHLEYLKKCLSKTKKSKWIKSWLIKSYIIKSEKNLTHLKLRLLQYVTEIQKY